MIRSWTQTLESFENNDERVAAVQDALTSRQAVILEESIDAVVRMFARLLREGATRYSRSVPMTPEMRAVLEAVVDKAVWSPAEAKSSGGQTMLKCALDKEIDDDGPTRPIAKSVL